jgi:ATP/maltotriose-dependent transcriptional regulator MalT
LPCSAAFTYLNRSPQIRTTILSMLMSTRADAIAALSIIESDAEDSDFCVHLIAGLRVYLSGSCI